MWHFANTISADLHEEGSLNQHLDLIMAIVHNAHFRNIFHMKSWFPTICFLLLVIVIVNITIVVSYLFINLFTLHFGKRKRVHGDNPTHFIYYLQHWYNMVRIWLINPLSVNPTKWSNTLKQFEGSCQRIIWMCLTI